MNYGSCNDACYYYFNDEQLVLTDASENSNAYSSLSFERVGRLHLKYTISFDSLPSSNIEIKVNAQYDGDNKSLIFTIPFCFEDNCGEDPCSGNTSLDESLISIAHQSEYILSSAQLVIIDLSEVELYPFYGANAANCQL